MDRDELSAWTNEYRAWAGRINFLQWLLFDRLQDLEQAKRNIGLGDSDLIFAEYRRLRDPKEQIIRADAGLI